ncbi:MAG: hypothetical protein JWO20_798 [Candidatus Angelobacter sp.]|jgi:hypothetical protein|nr:hypothetical protein [Candidatus Angelobacter sp.]
MGNERYTCNCGQMYRTGAVEWDHLGNRERRRRLRDVLGLTLVFCTMISLPSGIVYLLLGRSRVAMIIALFIVGLPLLWPLDFALEIASSVWRTRVGRK